MKLKMTDSVDDVQFGATSQGTKTDAVFIMKCLTRNILGKSKKAMCNLQASSKHFI